MNKTYPLLLLSAFFGVTAAVEATDDFNALFEIATSDEASPHFDGRHPYETCIPVAVDHTDE